MTKIVFLDQGSFPKEFTFTHPSFAHEWEAYENTQPDQINERLQGTQIAITNKVKLPGTILKNCPDLKMIALTATGYDNVDVKAAKEQSIIVSNVRGYAAHAVPEHAMALILTLSKSIPAYKQEVADGRWQKEDHFCFFNHPIQSLHGKTLGLIGTGSLGQGLAHLAKSFGMNVIYAARKGDNAPTPPYTAFDEFLTQTDIISIHCPLNEQTRNLISQSEFTKMTKQPILINTARGGIVNEDDAVNAIQTGQIRALGFDCLSTEPPSAQNPLLTIAHLPNVIITPHIAWASHEAVQTLWDQVITNIEQFQNGTPQNSV